RHAAALCRLPPSFLACVVVSSVRQCGLRLGLIMVCRPGMIKGQDIEEIPMAEYIPSPREWVRDQVELYERSGGTEGTTLRDTGLPVIIVTHTGNKTGAIRKTPLMRVKDGTN